MEQIATPESIAFILGIVISVVFEVWPQLKAKFDKFTPGQKFISMSAGGLGIVAVLFGMACVSLFDLQSTFTCDAVGAQDAFRVWAMYFMANQGTFGTMYAVKKSRNKT